jgi:hypothetical protein
MEANNMAARAFRFLSTESPDELKGAKSEGDYREILASTECADFGLVRDVAETHKHYEIGRASRQVTNASQTGVRQMAWDEGAFGEGIYGGNDQLVIVLDNGLRRPLSTVIKNVMEMWERLLAHWGA